jgi:DNA polymerase
MSREEIIKQLEFFRDIGVTSVSRDVAGKPQLKKEPVASIAISAVASPVVPAPVASGKRSDDSLPIIREDIGDCQRCKLAPTRKNIVFGSGNINAELVFVGEAPGSDEDEQGLPFVGRAGQLLTKIIATVDPGRITRDDVYICNILKCRPPNNRNPEPDEVRSCSPFLKRQLAVIRPKVVCCLGTFAAQNVLQSDVTISKLRGRFYDVDGIRVIATFHPAYLLRSPEKKREVWQDMIMIGAELNRLRS